MIIEPPLRLSTFWFVHIPMGLGARVASTVESLILTVSGIALERLTVILQVHKKQVKKVILHSTHTYTEWRWRNNSGCEVLVNGKN